jgi:hypothetical protein
VANQKREGVESILYKEKEKTQKLWKFINQEIPQLKEVVTGLTNKVDVHVESILLKDINQQEAKMMRKHNRQK